MKRKIGCFRIDSILIEGYPDIVKEILRDLIILRAEFRYDTMRVHYMAIGEGFEDLDIAYEAPHYNIDCQSQLEGKPMVFIKGDPMEQVGWLDKKLYACLLCCDEQTVTCERCGGSSEGRADGVRCVECCGDGEMPCSCVETDDDNS